MLVGLHAPGAQSAWEAQPWPEVHSLAAPQVAPQSRSVSDPFFTPSLQVAAAQVWATVQTRLVHWLPWLHSTQLPPPSQNLPTPTLQVVLMGWNGCDPT